MAAPPAFDDMAVGAYLLNPARTNYKLAEVSAGAPGRGAGAGRGRAAARAGSGRSGRCCRARSGGEPPHAVRRSRAAARCPCCAAMERHGIRVDPARLADFSKELDLTLERLTREIYAAGRRGIQHRLAQADGAHPLREAQAAARQEDQDRLLDRRRCPRAARSRPRAAREDHRAPDARQAQVHLCRRRCPS